MRHPCAEFQLYNFPLQTIARCACHASRIPALFQPVQIFPEESLRDRRCQPDQSLSNRRKKERPGIGLNLSPKSQDTLPMNHRSVPTAAILRHIAYRDVADARDWLTRVFGFTEYYRHGQPVSGIPIYLGNAYIMLTAPRQGRTESPGKLGYGTQMLTVIVTDVATH
jgi:hypothetical protein